MNNLIERLRAHEELGTSLEDEAADRIEQLEDQLSFMTKECQRFEAVYEAAKDLHRHLYPVGEGAEECDERLRKAIVAVQEDSDDLL